MALTEILPSLRKLSDQEKIKAIQFLAAEFLYLAISEDTYRDFFSRQFIQDSLKEYQIKVLIFDSLTQEIVLWKE
jgi:hypothetical protein